MVTEAKSQTSTYVVTGANRGIGLAFARELSRRGDRVIATARHPATARELIALQVRIEALDVADEESLAVFVRSLAGRPIDVLINNAGIGQAGPGLERLSLEDLNLNFRVNAVGPVAVTQGCSPTCERAGGAPSSTSRAASLRSPATNREDGMPTGRLRPR